MLAQRPNRPYEKVDVTQDLEDIENSLSKVVDMLFFGIQLSLARFETYELSPDDQIAQTEIENLLDKLETVFDEAYLNANSDKLNRALC